ncbi:MAG TPA: hypothetical protein VFC03_00535, partial [Acidimicrobiales bacterium]|nr:hypothetical protein [Acidimicrobiales bacterium]
PSEPPVGAVPLETTLPPPPLVPPGAGALPGTVTWKPPIDPVTGEVQWDQVDVTGGSPVPQEETPKKKSRWRKGAAAGAVAAGAVAVGGAADADADAGGAASAGAAPSAGVPPIAHDAGGLVAGAQVAAGPEGPDAPSGQAATTPGTVAIGVQPPTDALPGQPAAGPPAGAPASKGRRPVVIGVLVAVLLVAVAGIAYLLVKKNTTTTATTTPTAATTTPTTVPPGEAVAYQLAQSINLRLTDLPAGWTYTSVRGLPPQPLAAPTSAVLSANQALATCVNQPVSTVAALLGSSAPGQVAVATSQTFQSGSDPGIHMSSVTRTMGTTAEAQALAAPFAAPNFPTCFGQYETTLASAVVPGATAQVVSVTLSAPTGVQSFGYITTFTVPGTGTEVVGQAFIIGGRVEARLTPSTNGPPIPSEAFVPAYNAVTGRVAQAVAK